LSILKPEIIRANAAVDELMHHLVITIIIIAIMLVFALGWRESLIVTFSVPAILAITLFIAYMTGQTMNRITLFAFLLSLGLLVDAAIIVIENIHRHLHSPGVEERDMGELLVEATDEVGSPTYHDHGTHGICWRDDGIIYETNSLQRTCGTLCFTGCCLYLYSLFESKTFKKT